MDYTPNNIPDNTNQASGYYPQGESGSYTPATPSPSQIYNATAPNNAPQYHYGAPQNFFNAQYLEEQRQKLLERRKHEKEIRTLGTNTGFTLFLVLGFSYLMSFVLFSPGLYSLYESNLTFASAFGIFYSVISVGLSFFIGAKLFKKSKSLDKIPFSAPKDKKQAFLLILIGFGGCLVANYITVFIRFFGEAVGIYSDYTALEDPSSTLDVVMIFIGSAIVPPLIEEFALRGVLMHSLRKYGNAFAILTSAFVFGLFHGNAVQMPFAFLCGLVIGYAVIATESLWTGIIIHCLMNAMSAISSGLIYYFDEYVSNTFFYVGSGVGIALGIVGLVIYLSRYSFNTPFKGDYMPNAPSLAGKFAKFNTSPAMIIAIILYVLQAVSQLTTTPPAN